MIQIIANGMVAGARVFLVALGFYLIFRAVRFLHLAHAIFITAGAYITYSLHRSAELPFLLSVIIAVLMCGIAGGAMDSVFYRPIRKTASPLVLLLLSLGLYIAVQNLLSLFYGDTPVIIRGSEPSRPLFIGSLAITHAQIATVTIAVILGCLLALLLHFTSLGRILRAVGSNPSLALVSGIRVDRAILVSFIIGSAFAGVAGILACVEVDATPSMGLGMLMFSLVAVVSGMPWGLTGIVIVSVALGILQNLAAYFLGTQWQDVVAFAFLALAYTVWHRSGLIQSGREPAGGY